MNFCYSAQFAGLLCEEQGSDADNVKYCGYCKYHHSKLVSVLRFLFVLNLFLVSHWKVSEDISANKLLKCGLSQFTVKFTLLAQTHALFL